MKKNFFKFAALMMAAAAMVVSCTDDGPDGPNGGKEETPATPVVSAMRNGTDMTVTWNTDAAHEYYGIKVLEVGTVEVVDKKPVTTPYAEAEYVTVYNNDKLEFQQAKVKVEKGKVYAIYVTGYTAKGTPSEAGEAECMYYVKPMQFETSCELAKAIADDIEENDMVATDEIEVTLMEGVEYTFNSALDFAQHPTTFKVQANAEGGSYEDFDAAKGHKRPIVKFGAKGLLYTAAGLTIENVNFDCTEQEVTKPESGFITMSPQRFTNLVLVSMNGGNDQSFYLKSPIVVRNCNFKNMPAGFLAIGINSWSLDNITIDNCIMQFNSKVSTEFICFNPGSAYGFLYGEEGAGEGMPAQTWRGQAREIEIKNTTIYNIGDAKARIYNGYNADMKRHFTVEEGFYKMTNVTLHSFSESYDNSFNNTAKVAGFKVSLNNNVFYNVINISKLNNGADISGTDPTTNVIYHKWRVDNGLSAWSLNGLGEPNDSEAKLASLVEFQFTGTEPTALDLTDDVKGGQNFSYSAGTGDPRWK